MITQKELFNLVKRKGIVTLRIEREGYYTKTRRIKSNGLCEYRATNAPWKDAKVWRVCCFLTKLGKGTAFSNNWPGPIDRSLRLAIRAMYAHDKKSGFKITKIWVR